MTDNNPDGAAFADASDNALAQALPLPKLPPGKKYGPRIGVWGPYSIVDDVPAAPDASSESSERGPLHEVTGATK